MKRIVSLFVLLGFAFYVAWPAYSAYAIKSALEAKDAIGLRERIDFEQVRSSMRPAITNKVETMLDAAASSAGSSAAKIYAALKTQVMPKIVEAALLRAVTPDALIRVYSERGTLKDILDRIIGEQVAKSGAAPGVADRSSTVEKPGSDPGQQMAGQPGNAAAVPGRSKQGGGLTWRNIKGFGLDGPAAVYVRLAKDPAASEPDLTARMTFQGAGQGFGWTLTGLEPEL